MAEPTPASVPNDTSALQALKEFFGLAETPRRQGQLDAAEAAANGEAPIPEDEMTPEEKQEAFMKRMRTKYD